MLEFIRNKRSWKNKASETLEKHWELKYKDLQSQYEALKGEKSTRHEKQDIRECEYESLKREMQDLRSALDEKTAENLSLRDNLASLNSLIATKEAEKEIISAQLKEAELLRQSYDALSVTMLEEALLRGEEIKAKCEKALRLKEVSITVLKERLASKTKGLTTEKEKVESDFADALREAEHPQIINS